MKTNLKHHLQSLCDSHGGKLTPELVLDDARSESSPIHRLFEWDDTAAAHNFRLLQAAELIRRVKVRVRISETETRSVRAFVNIANPADNALIDRRRVYVPIVDAMRAEHTRSQVIDALHREVLEWKRRAEAYEIFAETCGAIRRITRKGVR